MIHSSLSHSQVSLASHWRLAHQKKNGINIHIQLGIYIPSIYGACEMFMFRHLKMIGCETTSAKLPNALSQNSKLRILHYIVVEGINQSSLE
jgi:hypothetical protein